MRIDNISTVAGDTGFVQQAWTSAGTIQSVGISATTTAPTMPTTTVLNNISYKQLGAKTWQVVGILHVTSATGGSAGSGDYLLTLPASLRFDTTLPMQQSYQGTIQTNSVLNLINRLVNSEANYLRLSDNYVPAINPSGIIIWDATRYRVVLNNGGFAYRCWGNTDFGLDRTLQTYWSFTFQTP